jgi:hypothetical protein
MSELETVVRSIVERNKRSRTVFNSMSSKVASLSTATTVEQIDAINSELERELHGILEASGEDTIPGGTDGSSAHESDVNGIAAQQ